MTNISVNGDACLSPRLLIKRPIKGRSVINRSLIDVRTDTAFYAPILSGDTCVHGGYDLARVHPFFFFRPLPRSIERNRCRACTIARRLDRLNYDARYITGRKRLIGPIVTSCGDVNSWKLAGNGLRIAASSVILAPCLILVEIIVSIFRKLDE